MIDSSKKPRLPVLNDDSVFAAEPIDTERNFLVWLESFENDAALPHVVVGAKDLYLSSFEEKFDFFIWRSCVHRHPRLSKEHFQYLTSWATAFA